MNELSNYVFKAFSILNFREVHFGPFLKKSSSSSGSSFYSLLVLGFPLNDQASLFHALDPNGSSNFKKIASSQYVKSFHAPY
jgi:hypothetical protein